MGDLFIEDAFLSFQELMKTYKISGGHFLTYNAHWRQGCTEPPTAMMLHLTLSHGGMRRITTALYTAFLTHHHKSDTKIRERWSMDLGDAFHRQTMVPSPTTGDGSLTQPMLTLHTVQLSAPDTPYTTPHSTHVPKLPPQCALDVGH